MDFSGLVKLFVEHPGAFVAVGEALVGGAVLRRLFSELMAAKAETLEMARSVLPVTEKLAQGVEALERMESHR